MVTSATDRTVFVVDDDEAALHSLCLLLKINGLAPLGFSSASEFLANVKPAARGCVITDSRR